MLARIRSRGDADMQMLVTARFVEGASGNPAT